MSTDAVTKACEVIGSQTKLAELLGVADTTLFQWRKGLRPVPIERAVQIERLTAGKVSRMQIRDADWWLIWPELAEKFPRRIPKGAKALPAMAQSSPKVRRKRNAVLASNCNVTESPT